MVSDVKMRIFVSPASAEVSFCKGLPSRLVRSPRLAPTGGDRAVEMSVDKMLSHIN
jgi:hypothetical protein